MVTSSASTPHSPTSAPPPAAPYQYTSSTSKLLLFIRSELLPDDPTVTDATTSQSEHSSDGGNEYDPTHYAARRREKLITFVSIPKELEKLMGYGFFQCADAFLYVFTFLPLRCGYACYKYATCMLTKGTCDLRASDKCELIKILILVLSSFLFTYIDTNVLYHVIKSQSVIKLYIFFNMLEVGDRLFGCFSQDTLDALFITATEQTVPPHSPAEEEHQASSPSKSSSRSRKKLSTPAHALICGVSILGHALVILLQSTTLSVAINANNRALLTVMMSNNFVELKGSVFKKFDKMNLFQVSCSDIRERFHLFVLLLIVCLQTLREYSWEEARFWVLLPDCLMVLLAEIMVDWLKHAFITRFNELPLQVYNSYTRSLAYDMAESVKRKTKSFSCDYSDVVGRRLGFVPLPLAIVLIRVITPMFKVKNNLVGLLILTAIGYVGLASFRILNTIVLVGKAVKIIDEHCGEGQQQQQGTSTAPSSDKAGTAAPATSTPPKNSILKRSRTISGSDGDLLIAIKNESKEIKKLTFVDLKVDDGGETLQKIHLLANSNVSLTSVGFNEEMLKVEEGKKVEGGGVALIARIGSRKHSLGSNLDDERVLMGVDAAAAAAAAIKVEEQLTDDDDEDRPMMEHESVHRNQEVDDGDGQEQLDDVMNTTVIENVVGEVEEPMLAPAQQQQQQVEAVKEEEMLEHSTTPVKEEASVGEHESGGKLAEKKKKLMNWFK